MRDFKGGNLSGSRFVRVDFSGGQFRAVDWRGVVMSGLERARELDQRLLHESVDGEWSFIETLRHLTLA